MYEAVHFILECVPVGVDRAGGKVSREIVSKSFKFLVHVRVIPMVIKRNGFLFLFGFLKFALISCV